MPHPWGRYEKCNVTLARWTGAFAWPAILSGVRIIWFNSPCTCDVISSPLYLAWIRMKICWVSLWRAPVRWFPFNRGGCFSIHRRNQTESFGGGIFRSICGHVRRMYERHCSPTANSYAWCVLCLTYQRCSQIYSICFVKLCLQQKSEQAGKYADL